MLADPRIPCDPRFTSHGERENFFLHLKINSPYRVVYYPGMQCDRHPIGDSGDERLPERPDESVRLGRTRMRLMRLQISKRGPEHILRADCEKVAGHGSLACASGSAPSRVRPASHIRVWPEGYVEVVEASCDVQDQALAAELRAIYGSRSGARPGPCATWRTNCGRSRGSGTLAGWCSPRCDACDADGGETPAICRSESLTCVERNFWRPVAC